MTISIIILVLSLLLLSLIIKHYFRKPRLLLPPGPTRFPLIGNLHHLLHDLPHRAFQKLSAQYGPLMFLKLGSIPTLVVSSPDIARHIFKHHDLNFSSRPILYAAKRLTYNNSAVAFAPYGHYWREMRKIVLAELLSPKRVQAFQQVRAQEINLFLHTIARDSSNSCAVNLSELTLLLSNNIVCRIAFGKRTNNNEGYGGSKLRELLGETQELLAGFCLGDFFPWLEWVHKFNGLDAKIQKNLRELDHFFDGVIKEHKESHEAEQEEQDLVDVLLQIQNDPNQPISVTDQQIKGVLLDIFLAGTDTSSATLVWTMTELIRNPESLRKAQQEVRNYSNINKERTRLVEERDVESLKYLKMVVKESLRLHPPAPLLLPRETMEGCNIKGFHIPPNTRVFINAKSIATDPKFSVWDDPQDFKPERFLEDTSIMDYHKGQRFEMLPFGFGRRGCPGVNFAMPIIELALANLLRRFDWELPINDATPHLDMEESFGLAMHKKIPLSLLPRAPLPLHL